jgi:hypothetical protein
MTGIAGLPLSCRMAIRSAALIYREIGREIEKSGYDSIIPQSAYIDPAQARADRPGGIDPFHVPAGCDRAGPPGGAVSGRGGSGRPSASPRAGSTPRPGA